MEKQKINEIEINGISYIPKNTTTATPKNENEIVWNDEVWVRKSIISKLFDGDIRIVILQRGWIYIGRFERNGNDCRLHNAYNIRSWGTKKGLAELVHGPTSSTILDKCEGVVEFDWLTTIHTIAVNKEKWNQI